MATPKPLSFQLYSARNFPPIEQQLQTLVELGYQHVEPYGGQYDDPAALKAALDHVGLSARSGHFRMDMLEGDVERAIAVAKTLGMEFIAAPILAPEERAGDTEHWQTIGRRLGKIAEKINDAGLEFAWHNHEFEFQRLTDGSMPIEHILSDAKVKFEIDIAWIARGGADPAEWIKAFAGRLVAFHFKDIAPSGEKLDEDGWADPGTGVLPWNELWNMAFEAGAKFAVAEHDNPSDFLRFATNAANAAKSMS
jgi:sugar phosphate isomerase/epimerase